jgi:phosphohistidine phosphatase SixA
MPAVRRVFFVAAVLVLAGAQSTAAQTDAEILVAAMQDGGKVIYLRHGITNQAEVDTGRLGDRAGQRNLTAAGIAQAKALGNAFRALSVPMGEILASPVFRARDTAELAFGADNIEVTMDIVADDYAGRNMSAMLTATTRLLRTPPPRGDNRILVGHRTPLELVLKRSFPDTVLPEGAMAVFVPDGAASEPRLLGVITAERFIRSATVRR